MLLISTGPLPSLLLENLESKYPALSDDAFLKAAPSIRYIVVLGGGVEYADKIPITSQFHHASLVRITEGLRLYFKLKNTGQDDIKLIVSGGGTFPITSAELMARLAMEFGIKENNIIIEKDSLTTNDEVKLIKDIVKGERFILVTSAGHMPRSMLLFNKYGMKPIPAPTDHWIKSGKQSFLGLITPNADNFVKSELVFYEYYSFIKAKLAGHI